MQYNITTYSPLGAGSGYFQLEQCRASLSTSQESRDQVKRELLETERQFSLSRDAGESLRREGAELRRTLGDITKERDTLSQSNTQLREAVRSAESERIR